MRVCFLLLGLFIFSCQKQDQYHYPRIIVPKQKNVIEVNSKEMLHTFSDTDERILAVNFNKDTVLEDKKDFHNYNKYYTDFDNLDTIFPKYNFKIIIDTSYTIDVKGFQHKNISIPDKKTRIKDGLINGKPPTEEQINISTKIINNYCDKLFKPQRDYVKCYPLLIFNDENSHSYIKEIRFIQEAKNKNGEWNPIEYYYTLPSCIGNNHFLALDKKKYFSLSIIKYHGSFKTKLRVKVEINNKYYYSNEFDGFINLSQFDLEFAKNYLSFWVDRTIDKRELDYVFLKNNE
jgi:hypothetical protein